MEEKADGNATYASALTCSKWELPFQLAPIAPVEYLEAALAFASNHDLGMVTAQLDLSNWSAGCIDLPKNDCRTTHGASRRSARGRVAASPDLNGRRRGIEVRFEHVSSITGSRDEEVVLSKRALARLYSLSEETAPSISLTTSVGLFAISYAHRPCRPSALTAFTHLTLGHFFGFFGGRWGLELQSASQWEIVRLRFRRVCGTNTR